jgi:hypothetical protein
MYQNVGYLEIAFQSLIYKSIQIMSVMSKLSLKSINKLVKVLTAWHSVFTLSGEIHFDKLLIIICKENNWIS